MLLDRDRELAQLAGLAAAAAQGDGRLILLAGEAGVGKSALAAAFCAQVQGRFLVRRGLADNLSTPAALGAVVDAFPELAESAAGAVDRPHLFRQVLAALSARPAVLLLEDVHWADEATCDLLRFLGRRLGGVPVLVLATYRTDEVRPDHPLVRAIGDLGAAPEVSRLTLSSLSRAGVEQLVAGTGSAIDAQDVYDRTGGNAFFVTEILAGGGDAVPATIRDAVLARTARLTPDARLVLSAAAVLGRRAQARLVAAVAQRPLRFVDECIEHGVLVEDGGGVAFRHELARLVVEQSLGPGARTELHERALVEVRANDPSDARALAHHAAQCGAEELVLEYGPRAARDAARVGSHREAAAHYRRALRVPDVGADTRAELLEALSYECYLIEEPAEALAARRRALELRELAGDTAAVGASQRWLSRLSWFLGRGEDSARYARRAVATLEPLGAGHELAMAYSNLAQLAMLAHDLAGALEWGDRALGLARALDDREVEIHALNNTGAALGNSDAAQGRHRLERSLRLSLAADRPEHAARAYTNLAWLEIVHRRWHDAESRTRAGIAYCVEQDLDAWSQYLRSALAVVVAERGRYDEALELVAQVMRDPRPGGISRLPARIVAAQIRGRRGLDDRADLDEATQLAVASGETQRLVPVAVARAEQAWLSGETARIAAEVDLAWDAALAHPDPWELGELAWWLSLAEARRPLPIAPAAPYGLMLDGRWADAATAWAERNSPLLVALSLGLGTDPDGLRRALRILDELDAPAVRAALLRHRSAHGLPAPRTPRTTSRANPADLTVRELEVLALVASGLSNRDVAQRLFISDKTVGHHMSAVLHKLGQPTRAKAVAHAIQTGIVAPT